MFLAAVLYLLLPVSGPQDGNRETTVARDDGKSEDPAAALAER